MNPNKRNQDIASRVNSLGGSQGKGVAQLIRALRKAGRYQVTAGTGPASTDDIYPLAAQVRAGALTQAQADESLAKKYPGQRFAGGRFRGEAKDTPLTNRGTDKAPAGDQPFHVEQLPETYNRAAVQRALENLAEQAASNDRKVRTSQPAFQPNTVDGKALAPGTVPISALDQQAVGRELLALPGPEEAIQVDVVQSPTMDRFVRKASTGDQGPGRIWVAKDVTPTSSARLGLGPARYRVVRPGMKFGVMSCRLLPTANLAAVGDKPGILVQYGAVVARIPHYLGRAPSRILSFEAVGSAPVAFAFRFLNGSSVVNWDTPQSLYWNRTASEYETQGLYPFLGVFGSDAVLAPVSINRRDVQGFIVQLITGRDANEVMQQLCTRQTLGKLLMRDGRGPCASLPAGLAMEAPTPPNCLSWDTVDALFTHRIETEDITALAAKYRIVQGLPFSYDDCAALAPTASHFSIVIQPMMEKLVAQNPVPAAWGTPEVWHKNGLSTVESVSGRLRNWALDIIVD